MLVIECGPEPGTLIIDGEQWYPVEGRDHIHVCVVCVPRHDMIQECARFQIADLIELTVSVPRDSDLVPDVIYPYYILRDLHEVRFTRITQCLKRHQLHQVGPVIAVHHIVVNYAGFFCDLT